MTRLRVAAVALAGVLAVAATTTSASAQWRGHHHHGGWGWGGPAVGIGAGIAAGALIGSAVAAQPYGGYYAEPGYGYTAPYAYDVGPTYYGSYGYRNWGYGPCFTDEGYGRRTPCSTTTR